MACHVTLRLGVIHAMDDASIARSVITSRLGAVARADCDGKILKKPVAITCAANQYGSTFSPFRFRHFGFAINVRFGLLCGLKSDISRGPRSARTGCEQSQQGSLSIRSLQRLGTPHHQ